MINAVVCLAWVPPLAVRCSVETATPSWMPKALAVLISTKYGAASAAGALKDSASERVTVSKVFT